MCGIKTGLNEAFVIDRAIKDKLVQKNPKSSELLKPYLEGKDLKKWFIQPRDLWIIYIPQNKIKIDDYPAVRDWLLQFKEVLENRATKQKWFELQQTQESCESNFEQPKIIYPQISRHSTYLDNSGHFLNNKVFHFKGGFFELGLLNSNAIWFLIKGVAPILIGGSVEIRVQYIETLPIPIATPEQKTKIGDLAQRCQTLTEARYKLENDTRLTISELGVKKLTQKLEKWWALDFQGLRDELKKSAKVEIELKKQTEWRNFFDDAKVEREKMDLQVRLFEKELNLLVYGLFGLDDEEVLMIEGEM